MPTNVVYDGKELRLASNREYTDSGTLFFVDAFNDTPTLETGAVHADSVVAKQFLCASASEQGATTQTPISDALGIVNSLKVTQSESKRYSIDPTSLHACAPLRPHISEVIIKQRLVSCFVFTQLIPIMISAIKELDRKVDVLGKAHAEDALCKADRGGCNGCVHAPCTTLGATGSGHVADLLAQIGRISDASGAHCGHVSLHSSLLTSIVHCMREQDAYIAFLERLAETWPSRSSNLAVGCFYVHRRTSHVCRCR